MWFPVLMPEIGVARARCEYQLVIPHPMVAGDDLTGVGIHTDNFAEYHGHVLLRTHNAANWSGHVGRCESGRRNLIEQRLEKMIVVAVNQGDINVRATQAAGRK